MTTTDIDIPRGCLPLQPLWEYLSRLHLDPTNAVLADDLDVSIRTIQRWVKRKWVGFYDADEIATRLCVHGTHIWGEQFFEAGEEDLVDLESAVADEEEAATDPRQERHAASTCGVSAVTLFDSLGDDELATYQGQEVRLHRPRSSCRQRRRKTSVVEQPTLF